MISFSWDVHNIHHTDWATEAVGYSLHLHYNDDVWNNIGNFLLREGLSKEEVTQVLLSKHMRWASDVTNGEHSGPRDPEISDEEVAEGVDGNYMSIANFLTYYGPRQYDIKMDAKRWVDQLPRQGSKLSWDVLHKTKSRYVSMRLDDDSVVAFREGDPRISDIHEEAREWVWGYAFSEAEAIQKHDKNFDEWYKDNERNTEKTTYGPERLVDE